MTGEESSQGHEEIDGHYKGRLDQKSLLPSRQVVMGKWKPSFDSDITTL